MRLGIGGGCDWDALVGSSSRRQRKSAIAERPRKTGQTMTTWEVLPRRGAAERIIRATPRPPERQMTTASGRAMANECGQATGDMANESHAVTQNRDLRRMRAATVIAGTASQAAHDGRPASIRRAEGVRIGSSRLNVIEARPASRNPETTVGSIKIAMNASTATVVSVIITVRQRRRARGYRRSTIPTPRDAAMTAYAIPAMLERP